MDGKLQTVDEIREWLAETVASYLEIPSSDIDPREDLVQYGVDSLYKVDLIEEIVGKFHTDLDEKLFKNEVTIEAIATWIYEAISDRASDR